MENKFSFLSDYKWVLRVLKSSSNLDQVDSCRNLLERLITKHKDYLTQKSSEYVYERLIREEFEMEVESKLKSMEELYCE
jgi:hypothetical protein